MSNYGEFFKKARHVKIPAKGSGKKKPVSLPIGPIVGLIVGLVAALWASNNVENIEKFVTSIDVRAFGPASAQDKAAKTDSKTAAKEAKDAAAETPKVTSIAAGSKNWTPEQIALFNKLEERKQVLDTKETELAKLEEELQKQKLELEDRVKELEKIRTKIADRLTERVGVDQDRVGKLVEIYSNMKPVNAAKVFEDIDEDLAVEVLGKMKKKNMAEILNLLKPDKAQRLSERFAGYKRQ
jgi:flagellar motility protein MotE (MotC chaperone)